MRGWWWLEILASLSNGDGDGDGNEDGKKAIGFNRACLYGGGGPQVGEVTRL